MSKSASKPLFDRLVHFIERDFQHGDRIPGERDLAEKFGVGRNQIREEMSRLEAFEFIKLRPKSRAIVTRDGTGLERLALRKKAGAPIDDLQTDQAIEVRRITEIASIRLACERATEQNFDVLQTILDRSAKKIEAGKSIHLEDEQFHLELIRATQNDVLYSTLKNFYALTRRNRAAYFRSLERCKQSHKDHVLLLLAIRARDATKAGELMEGHLQQAGAFWAAQVT